MSVFSVLYRKFFVKRYDDDNIIFHFAYTDFPGMEQRPVEFQTKQGLTVRGHIYSYPCEHGNDLVIFCHGMGGGHRSYMREIERICRQGYEVLAYDNIGCWESDGSDIRGLSESVNDLVSCMDYIASSDELKNRNIHIIGHSWGGYAAGNILNFRTANIKSVTVISGFASIDSFTEGGFGARLKAFKKNLQNFERKANPDYADSCSVDAFKDTKAKVLLIHSKDDKMADIRTGLEYVKSRVENPNVSYLEVDGKDHNPNYTQDAVSYFREVFGEYEKLVMMRKLRTPEQKKAFLDPKDFVRMTEQDEDIWKRIFANVESAK